MVLPSSSLSSVHYYVAAMAALSAVVIVVVVVVWNLLHGQVTQFFELARQENYYKATTSKQQLSNRPRCKQIHNGFYYCRSIKKTTATTTTTNECQLDLTNLTSSYYLLGGTWLDCLVTTLFTLVGVIVVVVYYCNKNKNSPRILARERTNDIKSVDYHTRETSRQA